MLQKSYSKSLLCIESFKTTTYYYKWWLVLNSYKYIKFYPH